MKTIGCDQIKSFEELPGAKPPKPSGILHFTAAQIAFCLERTPQAIRQCLKEIKPSSARIIRGQESATWALSALPAAMRCQLDAVAMQRRYRSTEAMLAAPQEIWTPPLPLAEISSDESERASLLRSAMIPSLLRQHNFDGRSEEFKVDGLKDFVKVFGYAVSARHWYRLFLRTVRRDAGAENWERLEIYLSDNPKPKVSQVRELPAATKNQFRELTDYIFKLKNPAAPTKWELAGLWNLAFEKYSALIRVGKSGQIAAQQVRNFLFTALPALAPSSNALRLTFTRRLERWERGDPASLEDGRKSNGNSADYPREDIRRVRHSAVLKNGARIDNAWREEYPHLSDYTRQRHERSRRCPRSFYKIVNREKVNALKARWDGRRAARRLVGSVTRNAARIPTMARWAVDDMTSNIEIAFYNQDGSVSLCQPQIIAVMDFASRKWIGWAMSNDKAPTAKLVCEAVLDGFKRNGVPRQLWVENGFVFGKSLDVNGKEDEHGRTVVSGLAQYGCTVHHFDKMSPTSKGELEKSFDLFQRNMERHPGYTGRNQMLDASEDFKREQRLIRSGKVDAKKFRYTFDEFIQVVNDLVENYNATPQYGHLNGISPNEAFSSLSDPSDPPIKFNNQLHWMLANARYRVTVKTGGVSFRLYGREIKVRGGELAKADRIGTELWAVVDRSDASMVTFMSLDYSETFTVEACQHPDANESRIASGSSVLAAELGKINQHVRAVENDLRSLTVEFGNPRRDLLTQIRAETPSQIPAESARVMLADPQLVESGEQMSQQRDDLREQKKQKDRYQRKAQKIAVETGIVLPAAGIGNVTADDLDELRQFMKGEETT